MIQSKKSRNCNAVKMVLKHAPVLAAESLNTEQTNLIHDPLQRMVKIRYTIGNVGKMYMGMPTLFESNFKT